MTHQDPTVELLAAAIQGRRSIRSYRAEPVPADVMESILEAARWAPSPHHALPFRFALVTADGAKNTLASAMGDHWRNDLSRDGLPADAIESEVAKSHRRLLGAPAIVVGCVCLEPLDEYPDPIRQQAEHTMAAHALGAAMQNAMLMAHAHGLGSGWMCAPLFCSDTVRAALDLPESWIPQAILTIGYAARTPPPGVRPPIDSLTTRRTQ
jgi:F420 biosynthesis protein FbiB-like protein